MVELHLKGLRLQPAQQACFYAINVLHKVQTKLNHEMKKVNLMREKNSILTLK